MMESSFKHFWMGTFFVLCLSGLTVFILWQFDRSYRGLERSHQMSTRLISFLQEEKRGIVSGHEQELARFRKDLTATEELLGKIKQENARLSERIHLLNQMAQLQTSVEELRGKNEKIHEEVNQLREMAETRFSTREEGNALLRRYQTKVTAIHKRIRKLETAAQEKHDRMISRLGNNGYLVKDGRRLSMSFQDPMKKKSIRVDVRFVK